MSHCVIRKLLGRRDCIAAHQRRWRQRHVIASVEDVTSALNRICREYADAPGPIERMCVVSVLAKLYADGTIFAENRPRDAGTVSSVLMPRCLITPFAVLTVITFLLNDCDTTEKTFDHFEREKSLRT